MLLLSLIILAFKTRNLFACTTSHENCRIAENDWASGNLLRTIVCPCEALSSYILLFSRLVDGVCSKHLLDSNAYTLKPINMCFEKQIEYSISVVFWLLARTLLQI